MAIENELLALAFGAINELGFEVQFWKGCGLNQCFPSVFGINAKFLRRKSGSISPYFCGKNSVALHLKCDIARKILSSPSFCCENTVMGMPYFYGENPAEIHVWCAIAHRQGFMLVFAERANMLMLGQAKAPQNIKHIDACRI